MSDDDLLDHDVRFVVSPHATLRWRQGRLTLASGVTPATLTIDPALLPLLHLLATPKCLEDVLSAHLPIEALERRPLLSLLLRTGAIEATAPVRETDETYWWDPNDRAKYEASIISLIQVAHGFSSSARRNLCVDHWGRPIPWLARPVIDYLYQLDLSTVDVFEFGGGASTSYWARRCRSVTCAESNTAWCKRLNELSPTNITVLSRSSAEDFSKSILETSRLYDIILIDAAPRFRAGCVGPALMRLAPGGMIILDDAPFYPEAAAELREANLMEVDMTGYSPLENNFQTTSLFLTRDFRIPRRAAKSPQFPFGSPFFHWSAFRPASSD